MSDPYAELLHTLRDHTLRVIAECPGFVEFRLGPKDGSWMQSTRILITDHPLPAQIIITGDLSPGANGILSNTGYGLGWFSSQKSRDYLCEKFLRTEFVPEKALEALKDLLKQEDEADAIGELRGATESDRAWKRIETLKEAISDVGDELTGEISVVRSYEAFSEFYHETFSDTPGDLGFGYNPRDAGWLCAIQQKFAELYPLLITKGATVAVPLFYLQDTRQYVGNCVYWWAEKSQGYTCHLDRAGLYTREEADEIVNGNQGQTCAWEEHVVRAAASLQVDIQRLRRQTAGGDT